MTDGYATRINKSIVDLNATLTKILKVLEKIAATQTKIEAQLQPQTKHHH